MNIQIHKEYNRNLIGEKIELCREYCEKKGLNLEEMEIEASCGYLTPQKSKSSLNQDIVSKKALSRPQSVSKYKSQKKSLDAATQLLFSTPKKSKKVMKEVGIQVKSAQCLEKRGRPTPLYTGCDLEDFVKETLPDYIDAIIDERTNTREKHLADESVMSKESALSDLQKIAFRIEHFIKHSLN